MLLLVLLFLIDLFTNAVLFEYAVYLLLFLLIIDDWLQPLIGNLLHHGAYWFVLFL